MDSPAIPGRTYSCRDPNVTFKAMDIEPKSGLLFGVEFHSMGGLVGPAH